MQSRYYNPEWGRFINADGIIGQTGELLGHNLFAYCKNNPVTLKDDTGFMSCSATDGVSIGGNDRNTGDSQVGGQISSGNLVQRLSTFKGTIRTKFINNDITRVNTGVANNSGSTLNSIASLIKDGQMTADGRNIVNQIDPSTKVLFRMDVGQNAHSIVRYGYPNAVNHINIEIQKLGTSGKWSPKWDFHMILGEDGSVINKFITGVWSK